VRLYPHTDEDLAQYSWDTFLRHCVYITNHQGSAMYDATLGDAELIEEMYQEEIARQSSKAKEPPRVEIEYRPPRRGYSREVEAIYDLIDNIVALRGELGRWPRTTTERHMTKRPWFPAEVVRSKMGKRARERRDKAINAAQARWRNKNAG
jgi:hypothetical protein